MRARRLAARLTWPQKEKKKGEKGEKKGRAVREEDDEGE